MIRVHMDGDAFTDIAGDLMADAIEPLKAGVGRAADKVVARIKQKLSTTGDTAAAAGEPPRKRKGDLVGSVSRTPVRAAGLVISSTVKVEDEGANGLEYGFVDKQGRHHLPHPFARPAFEELTPEIEADLEGLA